MVLGAVAAPPVAVAALAVALVFVVSRAARVMVQGLAPAPVLAGLAAPGWVALAQALPPAQVAAVAAAELVPAAHCAVVLAPGAQVSAA